MSARFIRLFAALVYCFIAAAAPSLFAQALLSVGSAPTTAADIGYTELAGTISLAVFSGSTSADHVVIMYPVSITNNLASDISIVGTGHLSGIAHAPAIDSTINAISFDVPAGGLTGDTIFISGVRLDVADTLGLAQVAATVYSSANTIMTGQTFPVVIGSVEQPFSIDDAVSNPLSYSFGIVTNDTSSFAISENYPEAFTGLGAGGGQTVATQIRITPFDPIPDGATVTFDATVTDAATGATLATLSGLPETVPRNDGSEDVVFVFTPGAGSSSALESFAITMTLTQPPASGSGSIRFQAALIPIGAAVPNADFPSTDIPRYAERLVPSDAELVGGSTVLDFPFLIEASNTYTGIAITNINDFPVEGTFTAYDPSGALITGSTITNPVDIVLPANGQYSKLASEIFGAQFNDVSGGMIEFAGQSSGLTGFYIIGSLSGPQLDGGNANMQSATHWFMPLVFHQGSVPFNLLQIDNPGEGPATVQLTLFDASGAQVANTSQQTVPPLGSLSEDLAGLFNVRLSSFQGGYVQLDSDLPVAFQNYFGNALESNILSAQIPSSATSYYVPRFATGGQNSTELTLVNTNSMAAYLTLTLLDNSGIAISPGGSAVTLTLGAESQATLTLASLFPNLGPGLVTGSIRIDVQPSFVGPFPTGSRMFGAVRFANADGSASSAVPLALAPTVDCVYSDVAQGAGYFTGLAVENTNAAIARYTVEVYSQDGDLVGSYTSLLDPNASFSKLVSELVPASSGQIGGYIRITSDQPLTSFAMFGSTDLRSLSAISPQIIQ
jgi:hypothetical protein